MEAFFSQCYGDDGQTFVAVAQAFEVLSDSTTRARYDRSGEHDGLTQLDLVSAEEMMEAFFSQCKQTPHHTPAVVKRGTWQSSRRFHICNQGERSIKATCLWERFGRTRAAVPHQSWRRT